MPDLATTLKVLADPTRLAILGFLRAPGAGCCERDDGVCACDLAEFLSLSQPTVSHHMKQLVEAGLVRAEKRGRWVYYQLDAHALRAAGSAVSQLGAVDTAAGSRVSHA